METVGSAIKIDWHKYAAILIAPFLAIAVSLAYFIVKSEDFLTVQSDEIKNNAYLPEVLSGQKYVQTIRSERNGLSKISLYFATFGRTNYSNVTVSLSDSEGNVIQNWNLKSNLLRDVAYRTLSLDSRIDNSMGQIYYLTITSDASAGNGITVFFSTEAVQKGLSLNGENLDRTICYRLTYRESLAKLFSKANGFHAIVLLVLAYLLLTMLPRLSRIRIENAFLVAWIFMSLMYLVSATLFRVCDEFDHMSRSYELSYGHLISDVTNQGGIGRELPLNVDLGLISNNWQSFSDNSTLKVSDNKVFRDFRNVAVYSPVTYLMQAIGIFIARNLTDNVAVIIYSGRIASWLFVTMVLYSAIRIIPIGKEVIALIALIPLNIYESISLASDGQVVAVSILMIAVVIYLRYKQASVLKVWQYIILFILALFISQLKIVYLPFILLYILIPSARFGNQRKKWFTLAAIGILAVGCNLIWLRLCSKFLIHGGSDFSSQLAFILHHPLCYMVVLARTILNPGSINSGADFMETMIGSRLLWWWIPTSRILVQIYLCVLAYYFWINRKKLVSKWLMEKLVYSLIVISIFILIATSEYLYWTQPYANIVDGIQGRYLIPLLLPLYFALNSPSGLIEQTKKEPRMSLNTASFIACINFCACTALLFYCIVL